MVNAMPAALGVWYQTRECHVLRAFWEQLLAQSPPIVLGTKLTLKPEHAHGFPDLPVLASDVFTERAEHFPMALPASLPWNREKARPPTPTPPTPPPPAIHAHVAAMLAVLRDTLCPTDTQKALLRDVLELDQSNPDPIKLEAFEVRLRRLIEKQLPPLGYQEYVKLMADIKQALETTSRNQEPITRELRTRFESQLREVHGALKTGQKSSTWDGDNRTRFLWSEWRKGARAAEEAQAVVEDDHDDDDDDRPNGVSSSKISFVAYGKEAKCKSCGTKEVVYANGESSECFYSTLTDRYQHIYERDKELAAPIAAMLKDCQTMPSPPTGSGGGRSIPAKFKDPLQKLVDAIRAAEKRLDIGPAVEEIAVAPTQGRGTKRPRKADECEVEADDDDEGDDDDEDEEDYNSSQDPESSSAVVDDEEEEEEEREVADGGKAHRGRVAGSILDFKRQLPMPDELEDLEQLWHAGDKASLIAVEAKIALLRSLPAVYGLRRSANEVWPHLYRKRETAEHQAYQLNMHAAPGQHNVYQVYEKQVAQVQGNGAQ
jgi:hypothetical protein